MWREEERRQMTEMKLGPKLMPQVTHILVFMRAEKGAVNNGKVV